VSILISILKSTRLWGLMGTAVVLYFLAFVVFGKLDVSWIMPPTDKIAAAIIDVWPKMPFFVQRETLENGQIEIRYTVPTHQLTRAEMGRLGITNMTSHPASPKAEP
jgi:hypothetical protein